MPASDDGLSPLDDADVEEAEERVLERQKAARQLAEQSWREFFVSLGVRTVVVIAVVLAVALLLKLLLG
jgi:hypothetical protein